MRVSSVSNVMSCQPLKSFGKAEQPQKNSPANPTFAQTFASNNTVSKEEYDKMCAKYDLACRIACAQAEQYNQLAAKYKAIAK